ncbi:unnamed protein product [Moneuplotes crassus]|uniref:USP domain-containing protein n=1 Tax=Euplotes crassus TaxID=5936 RepID=A0AAD1UAR5_EUPCR|nr:unnamed protein product [Moneuplotes crassus]
MSQSDLKNTPTFFKEFIVNFICSQFCCIRLKILYRFKAMREEPEVLRNTQEAFSERDSLGCVDIEKAVLRVEEEESRIQKREEMKEEEKFRDLEGEERKKQREDLGIQKREFDCWKYKVDWEGERQEMEGGELERWKGIDSTGMKCFMVASLQSLLSLPEFVKYFSGHPDGDLEVRNKHLIFDEKMNPDAGISLLLQDLVDQYYNSNALVLEIIRFRSKFSEDFPMREEHDSCEFILKLLQTLQNELNPPEQKFNPSGSIDHREVWRKYKKSHPSIIDKLFIGIEETTYQCEGCSHERKVYEEFKHISILCIMNYKNSNRRVSELPLNVRSLSNKYNEMIVKHPKYLMIVFGRQNPFDDKRIDGFVDYPKSFTQLDLQTNQEIKYTLNNVIINVAGTNCAHYSTICRRGSQWVHLENTKTKLIDPSEFKNPHAYILFYEAEDLHFA